MTSENPGNQIGVLEALVTGAVDRAVAGVSPKMRSYMAEVKQMVAEAYPGQDALSWVTIGRMHKAISRGNVMAYNAARAADPNGKLAPIIGAVYTQNLPKNKENLETLMEYESDYTAEHLENLRMMRN